MTEEITIKKQLIDDQGTYGYFVEIKCEEKFSNKIIVFEFDTHDEARNFALDYAQVED